VIVHKSDKEKPDRESIRYQIFKPLQHSLGRAPTDAELATAIDAEIERRKPKPIQLGLFDTGSNAHETRADAFEQSDRRAISRRVATLEAFERAGQRGLTRYELAQRLGCEQCSVTRTVQELLASSQLYELRERRRSAAGGEGCVMVLPMFKEGRPQ